MKRGELQALVFLSLGIISGIMLFFNGFKTRTKKKLIENVPTSTVRGMAMGLVEVQGAAQPFEGTVKTPFSKVESVFFHYRVEELRKSGKKSHWVTVKDFTTPGWFVLEDATGRVLVNPVGAELYLAADRRFQTGALCGGADAEAFREGLLELGISPQGFLGFDKELRCVEEYICPGDKLYLMGTAADNPLVKASATGSENLCIQKAGAPLFCISDQSEKELLASLCGKMYLYLYGGPALAVISLFLFMKFFFNRFI